MMSQPENPTPPSELDIERLFRFGKIDEAIQEVSRGLAANPNDPLFQVYDARLTAIMGDAMSARKKLELILERHPEFPPAELYLGTLEMRLGDFAKGRVRLEEFLRNDERNPIAHSNLAIAAGAEQDFERAEYHLEIAIESDPKNSLLILQRAQLNFTNEEFGDAYNDACEVIQRNPGLSEAWIIAITIEARAQKFNTALEHCDEALKLHIDRYELFSLKAQALCELGKREEATYLLEQAVTKFQNTAQAHCELAIMYADLKRWDDAEKLVRIALSQKPDYFRAFQTLDRVLRSRDGNAALAERVTLYQTMFKISPFHWWTYNNAGLMHISEEKVLDLKLGEELLTRSIELLDECDLEDDIIGPYYNLALAKVQLGKWEEADEALDDVKEHPMYAEPFIKMSEALQAKIDQELEAIDSQGE